MKHVSTFFTSSAQVEVLQQDLQVLIQCASSHYDGRCRQQVQHGGLIYALTNLFTALNAESPAPKSVLVRWTTGDVDLLCKILENRQAHELAAYLHDELANVLHFLNRCYAETPPYA